MASGGRNARARVTSGADPPDAPVQQSDPDEIPGDGQGQAGPRPHARATPVRPADGDDGDPVAAPAGEVDELHVEHDAADLLGLEQVVGRRSPEALEPALGVLDRARRPRPRPAGGTACRARAGRPAGSSRMSEPSGWIREPSATSCCASASMSSGSWSGGVAMSASVKTMRSASAASIPARTAAPLPPCGTVSSRRVVPAGPPTVGLGARQDEGAGAVRAAVVDDEDIDASWAGRPHRARRHGHGCRGAARYPNNSSRAGPRRASSSKAGRMSARLAASDIRRSLSGGLVGRVHGRVGEGGADREAARPQDGQADRRGHDDGPATARSARPRRPARRRRPAGPRAGSRSGTAPRSRPAGRLARNVNHSAQSCRSTSERDRDDGPGHPEGDRRAPATRAGPRTTGARRPGVTLVSSTNPQVQG